MRTWTLIVGLALLLVGFGLGALYQRAITEATVADLTTSMVSMDGSECSCMVTWGCRADHICYAQDMAAAMPVETLPMKVGGE